VPADPAALPIPDPELPLQTFRTAKGFELFNGIRDADRVRRDGWGPFVISCRKAPSWLRKNLMEFDYLVANGRSACRRTSIRLPHIRPAGSQKRVCNHWGKKRRITVVESNIDLAVPCRKAAGQASNSVDRRGPRFQVCCLKGRFLSRSARPGPIGSARRFLNGSLILAVGDRGTMGQHSHQCAYRSGEAKAGPRKEAATMLDGTFGAR